MKTIDRDNIQTYFTPSDLLMQPETARPSELARILEEKISDRTFPCVGAKQALHSKEYRLGVYGQMTETESVTHLAQDLQRYIRDTLEINSGFMTMIAVFDAEITDEVQFEELLWKQLALLKEADPKKGEQVEGRSDNPEEINYSFTFNGEAFYVVGLHSEASRISRRFPYPAMAFNLHKQFAKLKEDDRFNKMKGIIRKREVALQGSINPMLNDFGQGLEAPQYSGRAVSKEWKCPFH